MESLGVGLIGLLMLVLVVWAGLNVILSNASMAAKVLWIVVILMMPFIGIIAWLLFGPRKVN